MIILALDMASKTGWSLWENGSLLASGVQDFTKRRGESNGLLFLRFRKWLTNLCRDYPPRIIAYERAHMRGGPATEICLGLQTHAQSKAAALSDCLCAPVHTTTLKKFATGSGKASKDQMRAKASEIAVRDITSDDEADAICIGLWAVSEYEDAPDSAGDD